MKKFLIETKEYFIKNLLRTFIVLAILSFVIGIVVYILALNGALDIQHIMEALYEKVESVELSFAGILENNIIASGIMILTGAIPFLFIPIVFYTFNIGIIGVLSAVMHVAGLNPIQGIVFGILPHGITELSAIFLATAIGIKVCLNISLLIIKKKKLNEVEKEMKYMLTIYTLVIIPLIAISSVIEVYVTGWLLERFVI